MLVTNILLGIVIVVLFAILDRLGDMYADEPEHIQITKEELGKPAIKLAGNFQARAKDLGCKYLHVSLSHTKEYGLAQVILEGDKI